MIIMQLYATSLSVIIIILSKVIIDVFSRFKKSLAYWCGFLTLALAVGVFLGQWRRICGRDKRFAAQVGLPWRLFLDITRALFWITIVQRNRSRNSPLLTNQSSYQLFFSHFQPHPVKVEF